MSPLIVIDQQWSLDEASLAKTAKVKLSAITSQSLLRLIDCKSNSKVPEESTPISYVSKMSPTTSLPKEDWSLPAMTIGKIILVWMLKTVFYSNCCSVVLNEVLLFKNGSNIPYRLLDRDECFSCMGTRYS